jgi:uncharacterized membrane protein
VKEVLRSVLKWLEPMAPVVLMTGIAVVLAALIWLVVEEKRRKQNVTSPVKDGPSGGGRRPGKWLVMLAIILGVGTLLRLSDLDKKTLTHPEIYVPGIALPTDISEPPPRLDLATTVKWHYFYEPHPLGYYLAMFGWTKLFGTSALALRFPSALLGILSIALIFRVGALTYDRNVGLIAAGLLALHGLHIYWSQHARMYVPECFFGLLATWLLMEILCSQRRPPSLEFAYAATLTAGFLTDWFFWIFAAGHVLFTLLHFSQSRPYMLRLLYFQVLGVILGSHTLSHAVTTSWRAGSGDAPSLTALRDFFSFGMLYEPDIYSQPPRAFPVWFMVAFVISLVLMLRGLTVRPKAAWDVSSSSIPPARPLLLAALGMTILMSGLGLLFLDLKHQLGPISGFPLAAAAMIPAAQMLGSRRPFWLHHQKHNSRRFDLISVVAISALLPVCVIFLASFAVPMIARRALLIFIPYVLIVIAAGARALGARTLFAVPLGAALISLFAMSAWLFRTMPSSPRDYAGIANALNQRLQSNDVILVPKRSWGVTPLFYYIDASRLVAADYSAFLATRPNVGAWVIIFEGNERQAILSSVKGFTITDRVTALGAIGLRYERVAPE